jgi:hypothetical protein
MGRVSIICVLLVFALLLEDGSSVRKKTEDEKKEDEEVAKAVNRTLDEEDKKRKEEENEKKKVRTPDEKKKKTEVKEKGKENSVKEKESEDEACSPCQECPESKVCPEEKPCPVFEEEDCPPCRPCDKCPELDKCPPCKKCGTCPPCGPCPVDNNTSTSVPDVCPEPASMTVPVALAVGAVASLVVTGAVATLGLLLRYAPPLISGFLFLFLVALTWYLSSHYPETARELGGRAWTALQEATMALGHRVVEAIQRHQDQVGLSAKPNLFFKLSSIFHLKSLH